MTMWYPLSVKKQGSPLTTLCDVSSNMDSRGNTTFIIRERDDNPGRSVTNASEDIATELLRCHRLMPANCRFIEHYPGRPLSGMETWDEVRYTWFNRDGRWLASAPVWKRVDPPQDANDLLLNDLADRIMEDGNG